MQRSLAFSLALLLTASMLGAIDQLARVDESAPAWATQQPLPRA
jgi:hypothetical protein